MERLFFNLDFLINSYGLGLFETCLGVNMSKIFKKIWLLLAIVLAILTGYSYYCSFSGSCVSVVAQLQALWFNSTLDKTALRQQNIAIFQEKKLKYLYNSIFETKQLDGLDIKRDLPYLKDPKKYDQYAQKYSAQIKAGYTAPISLRFISDKVGYGVFAEAPIHKGDLVGEYTGIIKDKAFVNDTTFSWVYPSKKNKDGVPMEVSLDSKYEGNEMRYVNHANKPNTDKVDVPIDGRWYAAYIANQAIPAGKQITVSYGKGYWETRKIKPEDFD